MIGESFKDSTNYCIMLDRHPSISALKKMLCYFQIDVQLPESYSKHYALNQASKIPVYEFHIRDKNQPLPLAT